MPLSKEANRLRMREARGTKQEDTTSNFHYDASLTILTKHEKMELLSNIARSGNYKMCNPIEATKELNKMEGHYAPIKHQVTKVEFIIRHPSIETVQEQLEEGEVVESYSEDI